MNSQESLSVSHTHVCIHIHIHRKEEKKKKVQQTYESIYIGKRSNKICR